MPLKLKFFVLHPIIHCPDVYAKAELEVNEDSTWNSLKEEILSKLLRRDYNRPPMQYEQFSFVIGVKPTIEEQLRSHYALQANTEFLLARFWQSSYGLETQASEVANSFVCMMRQGRLDGNSIPSDLRMKGVDKVFVSIDVDFAIRCPTCEKTGTLGHVYHPFGTDYASMYTCLEVFCPDCGLRRTISTWPPIVSHIHDSPGSRPTVFFEPRSELIKTQFECFGPNKTDVTRDARVRTLRATFKCIYCGKIGSNGEFCPNCGGWLCSDGSCRQELEKLGKCPRCGEPIHGNVSGPKA